MLIDRDRSIYLSLSIYLTMKSLHKVLLYSIKVIPMLLAATALLNTLLSYFGIEAEYLSYIAALLIMAFLYIASFVFHFCSYHRLFLHYFTLNLILNTYDYYIGIPVSDKDMFLIYMIITGIFIFIALYLHLKENKKK